MYWSILRLPSTHVIIATTAHSRAIQVACIVVQFSNEMRAEKICSVADGQSCDDGLPDTLVHGHVIVDVQSEKQEVAITPQILVPVGVVLLPSAKFGEPSTVPPFRRRTLNAEG